MSAKETNPYQDPLEPWGSKFSRKFSENPWVPLGCLATCGALVMSAIKMRAGKSQQMNYWLRARVGLQGVTVLGVYFGYKAMQNARTEKGAAIALETREKERLGFEERLRAAQLSTQQEESIINSVMGTALQNEAKHDKKTE